MDVEWSVPDDAVRKEHRVRSACFPQAEVMEHKINRQREQCRGAGDHDGMDLPRIFRNPQPQHHHQGDQRKQRKYIHRGGFIRIDYIIRFTMNADTKNGIHEVVARAHFKC